jgi:hypothetical protein
MLAARGQPLLLDIMVVPVECRYGMAFVELVRRHRSVEGQDSSFLGLLSSSKGYSILTVVEAKDLNTSAVSLESNFCLVLLWPLSSC